jgi:hypothetical protein
MHRPSGCRVRKPTDCVSNSKPSCRPDAITIRREFVRVLGAFQHRVVAVTCKHEVGHAPNVDFRDHEEEVIRRTSIDG